VTSETGRRGIRPQRREVGRKVVGNKLKEVLRAIEILQAVLAKIAQRNARREPVGDQLARRAGDEDLATVAGRTDPRRAMHVEADVIMASDVSLASMNTHPHPQIRAFGPAHQGQRSLRCQRGCDCIPSAGEGEKRGVALSADLAPATIAERSPKHALVLGKDIGVVLRELPQQGSSLRCR